MPILRKASWMELINQDNAAQGSGGGGAVVLGASGHLNASQAIANNAVVIMSWDAIDFDVGGLHSGSPYSVYTAPSAGLYLCSTSITFAPNATGQRFATFFLNGSTAVQFGNAETAVNNATNNSGLSLSYLFNLNLGDTVEVGVFQNSGGPLNVLGTVAGLSKGTFFSMGNLP